MILRLTYLRLVIAALILVAAQLSCAMMGMNEQEQRLWASIGTDVPKGNWNPSEQQQFLSAIAQAVRTLRPSEVASLLDTSATYGQIRPEFLQQATGTARTFLLCSMLGQAGMRSPLPEDQTAELVEDAADALTDPTTPKAMRIAGLPRLFSSANENPAYVSLGLIQNEAGGNYAYEGEQNFTLEFRQYLISVQCVKSEHELYWVIPELLAKSVKEYLSQLPSKIAAGKLNRATADRIRRRIDQQAKWIAEAKASQRFWNNIGPPRPDPPKGPPAPRSYGN